MLNGYTSDDQRSGTGQKGKQKGVRRGRQQLLASYLTGPLLASSLIRQRERRKGLPKT